MVLCLKTRKSRTLPAIRNIMKIKSSLKSLKKRDLNSKLVRRRGRVYIINKTNPKFKARQKLFLWTIMTIKIPGVTLQNLYCGELSLL